MYEFTMHSPASAAEAVKMLKAGDHKFLAGGQSLLGVLKMRLAAPEGLVNLSGLTGLTGIKEEGDRILIGAMTTHAAVTASPLVKQKIPALAALAGWIGDRAVRNRGTIGGSLANNDPAACYPAAILALDAVIHTDRRKIAADAFIEGMYTTTLEPDEIITAVSFPVLKKAAYMKFRQPASRFAIVGVFVAQHASGVRVGVTGAGACAFRAKPLEDALTKSFTAESARGVKLDAADLNSDLHATAEYRAHLISVMAARAVDQIRSAG
jgi:carbon-monoxide dehydrogenase medium subunit